MGNGIPTRVLVATISRRIFLVYDCFSLFSHSKGARVVPTEKFGCGVEERYFYNSVII